MSDSKTKLSPEEIRECVTLSGRALRLLHDEQYHEAIRLYEEVNARFFMPANYNFLARAYVNTGRIYEAIQTLVQALEYAPDDSECTEHFELLRTRGVEMLFRYLVTNLREGSDSTWCRSILERNAPVIGPPIFQIAYSNALHNMEMGQRDILAAFVVIAKTMAEMIGSEISSARAVELEGLSAYISGDLGTALQLLRNASTALDRPESSEELAASLLHLGLVAMDAGAYADAGAAYARAIALFDAAGDAPNAARTIENLAETNFQLSNYVRAAELAADAERRYRAMDDEPMALRAMSLRGKCLASSGRLHEAFPLLQETVTKGRQAWAETPVHLADALSALASALDDMNRLRESVEARREAAELYERAGTKPAGRIDDAGIATKLNDFGSAVETTRRNIRQLEEAGLIIPAAREKMNLAYVYMHHLEVVSAPGSDTDDDETKNAGALMMQALALLDEAIATFREHNASGYLLGALSHRAKIVAAIAQVMGNVEDAVREIDAVIELAEGLNQPAQVASLKQNRAQILLAAGRADEAAETLKTIDLSTVEPGQEDLMMFTILTLARLLAQQGNNDEAATMFLRAVDLYETLEQSVGDSDWTVSWSRSEMVVVFDDAIEHLAAMGDASRAFELAQRAKARTFQKALASRASD